MPENNNTKWGPKIDLSEGKKYEGEGDDGMGTGAGFEARVN